MDSRTKTKLKSKIDCPFYTTACIPGITCSCVCLMLLAIAIIAHPGVLCFGWVPHPSLGMCDIVPSERIMYFFLQFSNAKKKHS